MANEGEEKALGLAKGSITMSNKLSTMSAVSHVAKSPSHMEDLVARDSWPQGVFSWPRDKLFLKCHIQLNQLWILMQSSLILVYFHDFIEERTMMLKVFPDDDLGSTTHDCKKEQEKGIHMTPTTLMSSISMIALPEHGNVFILGADTSRVGISITLMQDGPWHKRVSPKELQSMLTPSHAKKK
ncbi:hypothetical protein B296_00047325 [Ensete ventricosum]|uniref:Uncharacterized protein n=1 Tax=Ensete ventricosum TaxID=4639 RepID=A0A426YNE8_ENSVE|nr:hypothetical protein B296_00047325 [Ensete ventricosum]